jgi:Cof subfamily protein (haloacid dehalogenase superfamily)
MTERLRTVRPGLPKLVATDLDGTLVRSDDTVSDYTKAVLQRVRAAGIPVVGATGRGPRLTDLTRADLGEVDFLVLAGGGRVLDLTDPEQPVVLRDARLDGAVLLDLLARIEERVGPLSVLVEALDGQSAPLWGDPNPQWRYPDIVEAMPRHQALAGAVIKGFARTASHDVDALLAAAREVVPRELATVTQAGLGYVEICPPQVDKATGLAVVAERLGVDPQEVLVFGDMPNDLPMFAWAGFGRVAVEGAHPALVAVADEVTLSNDEDGVAKYLDRLLSAQ